MSLLHRLRYVLTRFRGMPRLRAFYWYVLRWYETEVCFSCGRPVGVVWTADDQMWEEVEGGPGGIRCIPCFDADYHHVYKRSLRWIPVPLEDPRPLIDWAPPPKDPGVPTR